MKKLLIILFLWPSLCWGMEDLIEWDNLCYLRNRYIEPVHVDLDDPRLLLIPTICPVLGDVYITSGKGPRTRPIRGASRNHKGIDIGCHREHRDVVAPGGGVVIFAGATRGGYGNRIMIRHTDRILTSYGHLKNIHVKPGDVVKRWDRIGTVGSTGISTGEHLDYIIYVDGKPVDPEDWIDVELPYKYRI